MRARDHEMLVSPLPGVGRSAHQAIRPTGFAFHGLARRSQFFCAPGQGRTLSRPSPLQQASMRRLASKQTGRQSVLDARIELAHWWIPRWGLLPALSLFAVILPRAWSDSPTSRCAQSRARPHRRSPTARSPDALQMEDQAEADVEARGFAARLWLGERVRDCAQGLPHREALATLTNAIKARRAIC